ncbi:MAG: hypothetical protein OXM87_01385 [Truepera sp.]|nr:hypothetical protein [Truepera sp.]
MIVGDKAYIGIGVLTPKRSNMTRSENGLYGPNEAVLVRPWVRPWTRVNLKIAAFNLLYSGVLFR